MKRDGPFFLWSKNWKMVLNKRNHDKYTDQSNPFTTVLANLEKNIRGETRQPERVSHEKHKKAIVKGKIGVT